MKPISCKHCQSVRHYSYQCFTQRKPIKKRGKHWDAWQLTKERWLEINKAPYYWCYICAKQLTYSQLTLDHIKSRVRHPELRYVQSNLAPCCSACNRDKGSKYLHEI